MCSLSAIWIGIDPGFNGALAALHSDGRLELLPMPTSYVRNKNKPMKTFIDGPTIKAWLRALGLPNIKLVLIEKAIVLPRQGLVSGSQFVGGQRYITGLCHGLDLNCEEILPGQWKRVMGLGKGNLGDKKAVSIAKCKELFPDADIRKPSMDKRRRLRADSHDLAEAALLAWFARERMIGNI